MARNLNLAAGAASMTRATPRTRAPGATPEMIAIARESFLANKEANAASSRARKAASELGKQMAKAGVKEFIFTGDTPTGGQVQCRAAIEPVIVDEIDVGLLRSLVGDNVFMQCIKATKGLVEEICGSHIANKAMATITKPEELKIKEQK